MHFKITKTNIIEIILYIIIMMNLGYGRMVNNQYLTSINFTIVLTAFTSIVLTIFTFGKCIQKLGKSLYNTNTYVILVEFFFLVELFVSLLIKNVGFSDLSAVSCVMFLDVMLVYPLFYIMSGRVGQRFIRNVLFLLIVILIIREINWFLYNYKGVLLFEELLFEEKNWSRNGIYRNAEPAITTIFYIYCCVCFSQSVEEKGKKKERIFYLFFIGFVLQYSILVYNARLSFVVEVLIAYYVIFFHKTSNRIIFLVKGIVILAGAIAFFSEPAQSFIFSLLSLDTSRNVYAMSGVARLRSIGKALHYIAEYPITGLGFFNSARRADIVGFTLSDAGFIGTIANYGLLAWVSIIGYVCIAIRATRKKYSRYDHTFCVSVLIMILLIECLVNPAFTYQRIVSVPFTLSFLLLVDYRKHTFLRFKR